MSGSIPYSANVFKLTNGTYTEVQPTNPTTIAITYYGGHTYTVTTAEADALVAAGYLANITDVGDVFTGTYYGSY